MTKEKNAIFDESRKYRYVLTRKSKSNNDKFVNFILLNPSTADKKKDDPTIKVCIEFTNKWGYGGLWVTNLFAFRATKPANLKKAIEPIGKDNNKWLKKIAKKSKIIIVAWGNHGNFHGRDEDVIKLLSGIKSLYCLGTTRLGKPKHPLYVPRTTKRKPFIRMPHSAG